MKEFKRFEAKLLKAGKISKHITKSKGKVYLRSKMYLKDLFIGKNYELYDLGEVEIEEMFGNIKGKGLLIFFPIIQRPKDKIGFFGEHRIGNRYLSRVKKF